MKPRHLLLLGLPLSLSLVACSTVPTAQHDPAPPMVLVQAEAPANEAPTLYAAARAAASALLASYSDEQRAAGLFPVDHANRTDWHYVPRNRPGVSLGELSDEQKHLLHNLLQTALSDAGYLKVTDILWLETVLAELEGRPGYRDINKYVIQLYGEPTEQGAAWGWRFEGHHLSINLLYADGSVAVTPMFLGTNPAVVPTGPLAGKRILADEHNLALELAQSMSDEQRVLMMIGEKPRDVITGPGREGALSEPAGINITELTVDQLILLGGLCETYFCNITFTSWAILEEYMRTIHVAGEQDVHFAWAGPTDGSGPFYYRIHSPTFVIEYSMQGRNHVHAVFHDLTDPLGEDLLRQHFEQHEHE